MFSGAGWFQPPGWKRRSCRYAPNFSGLMWKRKEWSSEPLSVQSKPRNPPAGAVPPSSSRASPEQADSGVSWRRAGGHCLLAASPALPLVCKGCRALLPGLGRGLQLAAHSLFFSLPQCSDPLMVLTHPRWRCSASPHGHLSSAAQQALDTRSLSKILLASPAQPSPAQPPTIPAGLSTHPRLQHPRKLRGTQQGSHRHPLCGQSCRTAAGSPASAPAPPWACTAPRARDSASSSRRWGQAAVGHRRARACGSPMNLTAASCRGSASWGKMQGCPQARVPGMRVQAPALLCRRAT